MQPKSCFCSAIQNTMNITNKLMKTIVEKCPNGNGLLSKMQQENMSEKDINRIFADLILAAGDTTAYSMQWTLYLLSKHMEVQNKLFNKLKHNYDNSNLLKNIIREALRLYPVAPFLTRILPENITIGGYLIPKETLIILSLYTSSRDSKHFANPEKFWPERWNREKNNNYLAASPYASLPFAMGARSCIGKKISDIQMNVALSQLTSNFKMRLMNEENVDMILRLVSVPSVPINIEISNRL